MVNVSVIAKRELSSYFLSPIAYVVLTAFALAHGILFTSALLDSTVELSYSAQGVFMLPVYLLIVAVPVLTMRLLSEETSSGTIESLMTTPVTEAEVVLGKFGGVLIFTLVMFVPLALELVFLGLLGRMDVGPLLSGFMGLFLLTAQFIAVGLFCSALTRVQVASAIASFVVLLGMYFLFLLGRMSTSAASQILRYISPPWHYLGFTRGLVDTRDLAYFVITTVTFLFLTVKALELRKWR